jgi:hypothetical protein
MSPREVRNLGPTLLVIAVGAKTSHEQPAFGVQDDGSILAKALSEERIRHKLQRIP